MHLEANQANQAVNVTVTVNGTGIVNVIDYSLLVQNALPNCGRSAQGAPFAQLALRRAGGGSHTRTPPTKSTHSSINRLLHAERLRTHLRWLVVFACGCGEKPARCCKIRTKNAHAGEGFSPLLQKSGRCRRGEIALFGIYFAFKARRTFFRYLYSSRTRSCA